MVDSPFKKKLKKIARPYDPPIRFVIAYYKFARARLYLFYYLHFRSDVRELAEALRTSKSRSRACFLLSSKNRADLTRQSLASMDQSSGFDVIWFDASSKPEAIELFQSYQPKNFSIVGRLSNIKGAEVAIMLALTLLKDSPYEFAGMTENDILYKGDWMPTLMKLFEADTSETGNPTVGAVSLRNFRARNLMIKDNFSYAWNLGAGMILFRQDAVTAVLKDYGVIGAQQLRRFYKKKFGKDIAVARDPFFPHITSRNVPLSCDTKYCMSVWKHGYACVASIPSLAINIDVPNTEGLYY